MIAYLSGKIMFITPTELIIDVNGVGYKIYIPISTYEKIAHSTSASLFIHTILKDDSINLYGFFTQQERQIFEMLISVNGIGPKVALSILSGISVESLILAISKSDTDRLVSIPGIGKKTVDRMILELKNKIFSISPHLPDTQKNNLIQEAIAALVTLGYSQKKSEKIIDDIVKENSSITLEELIKTALKEINS